MRRLAICFFLLFVTMQAIAIDAVVSHTVFYRQGSDNNGKLTPYVEIYWQINPNTLHYVSTPDKNILAHIKTDIILSNDAGVIKHDQYILQTLPIPGINQILGQTIIEMRSYDLPVGGVKMKFTLKDVADSVNRFTFSDSFTISPTVNTPFYSGLELLDTVYASTAQSAFKKNGQQQVPISTNFLDDARGMFYYYAELYRAGTVRLADYPLVQKVAVSKSASDGFYGALIKTDTITSKQPIYQASGKFSITSLPSGNYYLRTSLENNRHEVIASQNLFFQRLNKHPRIADSGKKASVLADTSIENVTILNLKKTFIAKYSLAEIRAILKMLLPFSDEQGTKTIYGFLKNPDELYMRYYIYNYFVNINKDDPGQAWKEFTTKITEVNKMFNAGSVRGYETERGFTYLRYGAPTDIITVENEQGSLPYEIWQYNTLTQLNHKEIPDAIFLFYRPAQMTTDYRLLHSTVEGEVQNPQWRSSLYINSQGSDNSNSRAEQYIGNR